MGRDGTKAAALVLAAGVAAAGLGACVLPAPLLPEDAYVDCAAIDPYAGGASSRSVSTAQIFDVFPSSGFTVNADEVTLEFKVDVQYARLVASRAVLVVDNSIPSPERRVDPELGFQPTARISAEAAFAAAEQYLWTLPEETRVAVVLTSHDRFSKRPDMIADFGSREDAASALVRHRRTTFDFPQLSGPLEQTLRLFERCPLDPSVEQPRRVALFTSGKLHSPAELLANSEELRNSVRLNRRNEPAEIDLEIDGRLVVRAASRLHQYGALVDVVQTSSDDPVSRFLLQEVAEAGGGRFLTAQEASEEPAGPGETPVAEPARASALEVRVTNDTAEQPGELLGDPSSDANGAYVVRVPLRRGKRNEIRIELLDGERPLDEKQVSLNVERRRR